MNTALILSGGNGTRLGGEIPKQYREVKGKPMIAYCLETLLQDPEIGALQIVAEEAWQDFISENMTGNQFWKQKMKGYSLPGKNRQLSIWNGLQDMKKYAKQEDFVLIHDAARPMLSELLIRECLQKLTDYEGVLPVLPMKDTVYLSKDGDSISELLDRSQIFAGQAPEAFRFGKYYEANARLLPEEILKINGSTEPAVMAGMKVAMIAGDERNFKVTTYQDLERFQQLV